MTRTAVKILRDSKPDFRSECVVWQGAQNNYGYGYVRIAKDELPEHPRMARVHRVVYWLVRGPFDLELTIDHLCHNRLCVNPYHLEPATVNDNSREAAMYQWHGDTWDEWEERIW